MPDVVLVHRISGLPRASFRFRLATDTLASGYALGATSCARDFHPLERAHAGHTEKRPLSKLLFDSGRSKNDPVSQRSAPAPERGPFNLLLSASDVAGRDQTG